MHRGTAIALSAVLCAGIVTGCADKEDSDVQYLKVGVVIYKQNDTFIGELINCFRDDIKALQNENLAITVAVKDGEGSQKTENARVEELIDSGCDVLCVNLVDRTAPSKIIDMAMEKNIPLIFYNREPVKEDLDLWENIYYIGCDAKQSGVMQGELAAAAIAENPRIDRNHDGKIQYVVLQGEPGHQDAIIRTENSVNTLLDNGVELEKLSYQIANWNRAQAQAKMSQMITQYGNRIELVLANNDDMALGAIDAYNLTSITETDRPVVFGTDGTKTGQQALRDGTLAGTVYNDKEGQAMAMAELAVALGQGETTVPEDLHVTDDKYIYLPYKKMTKETVTEEDHPQQ